MASEKLHQQWSTEIPETGTYNSSNIRRCFDPLASPQLAYEGCYTVYEALRRGQEINPMAPCLGFRAISSSGFATPYVYSSYNEVVARVDAFAAGLEKMNLLTPNEDGTIMVRKFCIVS